MIDQEKPYSENPAVTPVEPVDSNIPPMVPTVVVPSNGGGVPRWFYFVFGITFIIFLLVTGLLVLKTSQKPKQAEPAVPTVMPSVVPTAAALPSLPPDATNAGILDNALESSDEITTIETDLNNLDFAALDLGLEEADREFNSN